MIDLFEKGCYDVLGKMKINDIFGDISEARHEKIIQNSSGRGSDSKKKRKKADAGTTF